MARLSDMLGGDGAPATFLGLPEGTLGEAADIVLLGVDCATPYASVGPYCAGGAAALRTGSADYAGALERVNFDLGGPILPAAVRAVDAGDLPCDPGDAPGNRARIAAAVRQILGSGAVPVLLGGDDSVPIPMLQALETEGPISIVQIDAHIDWRDEVQGERWGLSSTMRRASEMPHVAGLVQVGARGVGSAGMDALEAAHAYGAHLLPAHLVDAASLEQAAAQVPEGGTAVICLDWDALDPSIMPAVIAPTAGGLSYQQALTLIHLVAARARIAAVAVVEFKADSDLNGIGARTGAQLLTSILGLVGKQCAASQRDGRR